jgi:hypothetical protein
MHKATLTITLAATLLGAQLLSGLAQAASPIEGQLISNVTFDCRGTINYVVAPNSNNPAFVGMVQATIDLPGGHTAALAGIMQMGPDHGANADVHWQSAAIDRCVGSGDLQVGACGTFNGLTSCDAQLASNNARIHIDRGSNGIIILDQDGTTFTRGVIVLDQDVE